MPPPSYPIPTNLPTLHLYRHILREVSYLPPAFRQEIASTIQTRFHRHRRNAHHPQTRVTRALGLLRILRGANSGDRRAMDGLMTKGFGRIGSQRRSLMSKLVQPQGPSNNAALEALLDKRQEEQDASGVTEQPSNDSVSDDSAKKAPKKPKNGFFQEWNQERLAKIMRSQVEQFGKTRSTADWQARPIKRFDPDALIEGTNIWGKPHAENVVRTKRARWWRRAANKIMPPLAEGKWNLLGRLSAGAQEKDPDWKVPERRPLAQTLHGEDMKSPVWDWKAHASHAANRAEKPRSLSQHQRTGRIDSGPYGAGDGQRSLSPRAFRRAYNRTWQMTPHMKQDPNTLKYSYVWGSLLAKAAPPTKEQLDMFEGVSANAKP